MKDIDAILSKHAQKPNRHLSSSFTDTVLSEIKSRPCPSLPNRLVHALRARFSTKTGLTSLAGVLVISGAATALALWPKPTVTQTVAHQLPSGNHIVGYDTQNCNYFNELNGSPIRPTNEAVYYEVRRGSSLTDQQLRDALQGVCEENMSNAAITHIISTSFAKTKDTAGFLSTESYVIRAVASTSLTIVRDPHYSSTSHAAPPNQTYTRFSEQLLVSDQDNPIRFSDLHVGDTIKMIVQDTSGKNSETAENYNPFDHPTNILILAIIKTPPLTEDPTTFYTSIVKDIVRVEPCKTSPTVFCRAYDFGN